MPIAIDTMQAAVLYGKEDVRLESVPVPAIGPGEMLVRVRTALTCGTDVKVFKRGYHGVYHWMSPKHLQKYVDEFVFRLNRKGEDSQSVFSDVVASVATSSQLPYKELIA